jgi:transcriptional regulator with XRE-family HTH domain
LTRVKVTSATLIYFCDSRTVRSVTQKGITVTALARQAGVERKTARDWLNGKRNTQPAKEAALEGASKALGGTLLKRAAFFDLVLSMGARRAVEP